MYTKDGIPAGTDEKVIHWANWRINGDELDKFYCTWSVTQWLVTQKMIKFTTFGTSVSTELAPE